MEERRGERKKEEEGGRKVWGERKGEDEGKGREKGEEGEERGGRGEEQEGKERGEDEEEKGWEGEGRGGKGRGRRKRGGGGERMGRSLRYMYRGQSSLMRSASILSSHLVPPPPPLPPYCVVASVALPPPIACTTVQPSPRCQWTRLDPPPGSHKRNIQHIGGRVLYRVLMRLRGRKEIHVSQLYSGIEIKNKERPLSTTLQVATILTLRPSHCPVFYRLQYTKTEGKA